MFGSRKTQEIGAYRSYPTDEYPSNAPGRANAFVLASGPKGEDPDCGLSPNWIGRSGGCSHGSVVSRLVHPPDDAGGASYGSAGHPGSGASLCDCTVSVRSCARQDRENASSVLCGSLLRHVGTVDYFARSKPESCRWPPCNGAKGTATSRRRRRALARACSQQPRGN